MSKRMLARLGLACSFLLLSPITHAGQWSQESIANMPVRIYTPTTAPALDDKRALMISLGGCGQQAANNTEFKDQSNWEPTADQYGMVVAIPNAPGGGVLWAGCWDYYDSNHTRSNRHNGNLLQLAQTLKARHELNIDPNQVYISGLSSGGGMVNVMTCVAPDVFAGGGNSAGPALGTASSQTTSVATSPQAVRDTCIALAGSYAPYLDTQIMSVVWGSDDYLAAPGYADTNAQAYALIYGASKDSSSSTVPGNSLDGVEETWSDSNGKRVSKIMIQNLAHAWPAGGGSGASQYMDNTSINYPAVLTQFLFENNRRTSGAPLPPPPPGDDQDQDDESEGWNGCGSATNSEHDADGRTEVVGGAYYYAKGSWDYLGTGGTVSTLKETRPGYFVKVENCSNDGNDGNDGNDDGSTPPPSHSCTSTTSSTWDHYQAGRAESCGWDVCAVGSGDNLGLNNTFNTQTLAETAPGYYQLGSCQ